MHSDHLLFRLRGLVMKSLYALKFAACLGIAGQLLAPNAWSAPIPGLYSTGVDATGALLTGGSTDPHYSSSGNPAYVLSADNLWGGWPASSTGKWINYADTTSTYGWIPFSTSFDLAGLDPNTAQITMTWTGDNGTYVYLNGVEKLNLDDFSNLHTSVISSGFQAGINTLSFSVWMDSWDGLLVSQISGTADALAAPEPASLALLLAGGLMLYRRGRREA
jgi:hypothetical protein